SRPPKSRQRVLVDSLKPTTIPAQAVLTQETSSLVTKGRSKPPPMSQLNESIRLIKQQIPYVKTVLQVFNISFWLSAAARQVVNSVFLYYSTKARFDLAIVNAEKLERFASIPEEECRLAEVLPFNTPPVDVSADHLSAALLENISRRSEIAIA